MSAMNIQIQALLTEIGKQDQSYTPEVIRRHITIWLMRILATLRVLSENSDPKKIKAELASKDLLDNDGNPLVTVSATLQSQEKNKREKYQKQIQWVSQLLTDLSILHTPKTAYFDMAIQDTEIAEITNDAAYAVLVGKIGELKKGRQPKEGSLLASTRNVIAEGIELHLGGVNFSARAALQELFEGFRRAFFNYKRPDSINQLSSTERKKRQDQKRAGFNRFKRDVEAGHIPEPEIATGPTPTVTTGVESKVGAEAQALLSKLLEQHLAATELNLNTNKLTSGLTTDAQSKLVDTLIQQSDVLRKEIGAEHQELFAATQVESKRTQENERLAKLAAANKKAAAKIPEFNSRIADLRTKYAGLNETAQRAERERKKEEEQFGVDHTPKKYRERILTLLEGAKELKRRLANQVPTADQGPAKTFSDQLKAQQALITKSVEQLMANLDQADAQVDQYADGEVFKPKDKRKVRELFGRINQLEQDLETNVNKVNDWVSDLKKFKEDAQTQEREQADRRATEERKRVKETRGTREASTQTFETGKGLDLERKRTSEDAARLLELEAVASENERLHAAEERNKHEQDAIARALAHFPPMFNVQGYNSEDNVQKIQELNGWVRDVLDKNTQLDAQLLETVAERDSLAEENEKLKASLAEAAEANDAFDTRHQEDLEKMRAWQVQNQELDGENQSLHHALQVAQGDLATLTQANQALTVDRDSWEARWKALDKQFKELEKELAAMRAERDGLRVERDGLKTNLHVSDARATSLEGEKKQLVEDKGKLENKVTSLEQQNRDLNRDKTDLEARLKALEAQYRADLAKVTAEKDAEKARREAAEQDRVRIARDLKDVRNDNMVLTAERDAERAAAVAAGAALVAERAAHATTRAAHVAEQAAHAATRTRLGAAEGDLKDAAEALRVYKENVDWAQSGRKSKSPDRRTADIQPMVKRILKL